ncbi:NAD(P)H-dependent flavin oxidoreductase [Bacillus fonticola]|uniref:NAD(P)H-dependent flavin oxidoreductase n=1 Tax=Bacillus fonticola TaxID=2728853 RepID=UPI001472B7F5|nr:nitronate monooxygenase [Bacillus fonticola]
MKDLLQKLGISIPILQGGMGNISHAELTAAVSNAGGLGTLGVGTLPIEEVRSRVKKTKSLTSCPFALNIPLSVHPDPKGCLKIAVEEGVRAVVCSAGNPAPYVEKLHANGITVLAVVGSLYHAQKAEQAGVDAVIVEGVEAAGINATDELTTLVLAQQVLEHVHIPVVVAGGIGTGRALAAMLALGASGVQIGTRLIVTKDAKVSSSYKEAVCAADQRSTTIIGRSVGQVRRVLQGEYVGKLLDREKENMTMEYWKALTDERYHIEGAMNGNTKEGFQNGGQISALIRDEPTVNELFTQWMEEAERCLSSAQKSFIE